MFVSLLQLMGFSTAAPVHSRADEKAPPKVAKTQTQSAAELETPAFPPKDLSKIARRPPVKAPAVKPKAVPAKAVVATKPAPVAKPAKTVVAKKAAVLPPVVPAKPAKSVSPPVAKPVAKSTIKAPAAKAPVVKAQPAAKAPVAKVPLAKKVEPAPKVEPAKPVPVATPIPPRSKKKLEPVSTIDPTETAMSSSKTAKVVKLADPVAAAVKPAPVAPPMTPLGVPVRSGRPSSRLAQLTVPSMAQSVASTAAKASFTQMTTVQPIVSPLASAVKKDPKLANNWKKKPVTELLDAEVMAMSDDEYMNDTQMAFFRHKLVVLKNDILSNAGETTEHLREDTVVVPDPADRATIEEEHALELRTRDRERKLLKKIEQSINRIDAGDYGYCDETGEPIGVGRLLARPTATLSLEAQQRRELKQKMFGD